MKRLLIISPYFPPSNAADMQRIRMSLPYFKEFNWLAEVVTVHPRHSEMVKDALLEKSLPSGSKIHYVEAFSKTWTSKVGLGSLGLRSMLFYMRKVNRLLRENKYDLIYFSTTQFPVTILGRYWKAKFRVPYIIDFQDPWHSDYYKDKPRHQRPPKYWFSYRLNKYLEPIALKKVDGIISVSDAYIKTLQQRYPRLKEVPSQVITFGANEQDFEVSKRESVKPVELLSKDFLNLVYIGRGGADMYKALHILFTAFGKGLQEEADLFNRFKMLFIGTSYAPKDFGIPTISPVASNYGLEAYVTEQTDRIPFYQGIATLQVANGLIVPGSDDPAYTASKIYPYILAKKPLLGIFHPDSSVVDIVKTCKAGEMITLESTEKSAYNAIKQFLLDIIDRKQSLTNWDAFSQYTAKEMTQRQCDVFNEVGYL